MHGTVLSEFKRTADTEDHTKPPSITLLRGSDDAPSIGGRGSFQLLPSVPLIAIAMASVSGAGQQVPYLHNVQACLGLPWEWVRCVPYSHDAEPRHT